MQDKIVSKNLTNKKKCLQFICQNEFDVLFFTFYNMENKIANLETLRFKGKSLWISYFKETNIKKASQILKQRSTTMDKIHSIQNEINKLLLDNLIQG